MSNPFRKLLYSCFITYCLLHTVYSFSQDELDIVDPYQMKVSRSKEADTFYFTQNKIANVDVKKKLDTLRSYDVFLEERQTPFGTAYICNGNEVTKKKYVEFKRFWNAAGACKPCLLYTYDDKDQLKYVAYQYQDCLCGSYKEYYPEGSLKVEGQFKKIQSDNFENLNPRNQCNVRDGIWTYYFENGVTEKTETYVDGKLKDSISSTNTNKKSSENEEDSDSTNEPKKGLFKKLKDKNKSIEN
jgi:antitoxin component YwqK of YwqJK toxin-antitoxin module